MIPTGHGCSSGLAFHGRATGGLAPPAAVVIQLTWATSHVLAPHGAAAGGGGTVRGENGLGALPVAN